MSVQTQTRHLYRSVLRELRLASKKSRTTRNMTVNNHFRSIVQGSKNEEHLSKTLLETRDFLRASRVHAELVKRYNPISDMTEEERINATARRVGLDTPFEYKPE